MGLCLGAGFSGTWCSLRVDIGSCPPPSKSLSSAVILMNVAQLLMSGGNIQGRQIIRGRTFPA